MGKLKLKYGLWEDYEDELQHDNETLYFITDKHEIYKGDVRYAIGQQSNVQADWNQTDNTAADFIKNKPVVTGTYSSAQDASRRTYYTNFTGLDNLLTDGIYLYKATDAAGSNTVDSFLVAVSHNAGNIIFQTVVPFRGSELLQNSVYGRAFSSGSWSSWNRTRISPDDIDGLSTLLNWKEDTTNKVTTLSSASTDTQYPSAKAVYDAISTIQVLQSDWAQTDSTAIDFIKNKPIINGECKIDIEEGPSSWEITGLDNITEPGTYIFNCQSTVVDNDQELVFGNNSIILQVINDPLTGHAVTTQVLYGLPLILMYLFPSAQECLESEIYLGVLLVRSLNDQTWDNWEINRCTNDIIDYKLDDFATNTLAPVATSGSYNDLYDKPEITQTQSDWTETHDDSPAYILHKPQLSTVATSGNYNDLSNKPNLTLKEDKSNKVTTLSSTSTDTQYPSAKAVSDFVKNYHFIEGDITITENSSGNKEYAFSNLDNVITPGQYVYIGTYTYITSDNITIKYTYPFLLGVSNDNRYSTWQRLTLLANNEPFAYGLDIKRLSYFSRQCLNGSWDSKWVNYTIRAWDVYGLAAVASSGSYTDLTNKPTIPSKTSDLTNDGSDGTDTYVESGDLATVATSGSYTDLTNTPTIPSKTSDLTNDGSDGTDTYVESGDLATVATSGDYTDLINTPTIPTVGDGTITIQKNSTTVDTFTVNQSANKTINIAVPTQASDINALPDTTKYGKSFTMSIDSSTYVVTATLKDQDGNTLGTPQTIDLPIESVVVGGRYDDTTKKVILTLQNGSTVEFSVADLVAGLQSEITANNKLSADLVDDTSTTNKFATASQLSKLDGLQNITAIGSNLSLTNGTLSATDTTYNNFTGADGTNAGAAGLVPAPTATDNTKFLKGDGTWAEAGASVVVVTFTNVANSTSTGSMTANQVLAEMALGKTVIGMYYNNRYVLRVSYAYSTGSEVHFEGVIGGNYLWTFTGTGNSTTYTISSMALSPTVGNGTITVTQGGVDKGSFTVNQTGNTTIALDAGGSTNVQSDWSQTDTTADDYIKNKPTIPSKTSDLTNDSGFVTSSDVPTKTSDLTNDGSDGTDTYVESGDLATVATSGDYTDLTNKPTIPTVGDGTITIQKNSTTVDTFTVNQSANKTINIAVPTKTSDLTNDGSDGTDTYVESGDLATVATSGSYTDLINTPTIPAAQVNSDWSANSGVAQILNKPTTIAGYGITDAYTKTEVDTLVASAYKFAGTVSTVSGMGALIAANVGNVYNFDTSFTTTSDFVEGAGITYPAGTNVAIAEVSTGVYKYDVLAGFVDISGKQDIISGGTTDYGTTSISNNVLTLSSAPVRKGTGTGSAIIGSSNTNSGSNGLVEGQQNSNTGNEGHVEGAGNASTAYAGHTEGYGNTNQGNQSHVEGSSNQLYDASEVAHVEGYNNIVRSNTAHIEGRNNYIYKSVTAEGAEEPTISRTSGSTNHIEGWSNRIVETADAANCVGNHIEGYNNKIENTYAAYNHIEGEGNEAINSRNHVEGYNNISSGGAGAHVEGMGCRTRGNTQHVQGKYNVEDWNGDYAHIIGNGTENSRSNAQTVTWTGTEWLATDVTCGGTNANPAHQLSHKIDEAPTDGRKYVRQSSLWQAADGLLEYKGVVASAGNLPGNPLKISYGSGTSAVEYWAVFQFNNSTGKCTGMTLSVHPAGDNTSAWFRNGENILRNGGSVLSLNGYLLEYNLDFTTTPTNNGPWGQGVTSIQYSFNVDVYENDVLTFSCNTWATENNGNGYKITDTNYTVAKPDAQSGEVYFVQDEMEVYMYDGSQWFSFAPNDIYQLDANHLTLVNGYHNYFSTYTAGILQVAIPDNLADGKYEIDCPTYVTGAAYPPAVNITTTNKTISIIANFDQSIASTGYHISAYVSGTNVYLYFNKN